jgi:hypothetical protein
VTKNREKQQNRRRESRRSESSEKPAERQGSIDTLAPPSEETATKYSANRERESESMSPKGDATNFQQRNLSPQPELMPKEIDTTAATGQVDKEKVLVHVKVIRGYLPLVSAPVAITGRYQKIPVAGPAKDFDQLLDGWLSRAVELGMVGSDLGELYFVPLTRQKKQGVTKADNLLMFGMGEPGHFGSDDLSYLISNATVAVKEMRHDEFSVSLIGSRRGELSIERAVRGLLEGIVDGFERFRGVLQGVTKDKDELSKVADAPLIVYLVEEEKSKIEPILQALSRMERLPIPGLILDFAQDKDVPAPDSPPKTTPIDLEPAPAKTTLLRIGRNTPTVTRVPDNDSTAGAMDSITTVFQVSALGDSATITVREVPVQLYFVRQLPDRLINSRCRAEQMDFGLFLTNYLIPEDFRRLITTGDQLTLVLDANTACFPWEMAAFRGHRGISFFGMDLRLTRQFRTLLSAAPGVAPPLNHTLKMLIIADPAGGNLSLPGARAEGEAVVEVLKKAKRDWGDVFDLQATVRIGSYAEKANLRQRLDELRGDGAVVRSAKVCDPFELLMLMVDEDYDVVHYSGHGIYDEKGGRMGWVFDHDCVLSAAEIFRVRQVPRLVFANACHSAAASDHEIEPEMLRQHQVGLAQAFFARGIKNYIGAGWAVDDDAARELAVNFYRQALGRPVPTAPPATLGDSLANARRALFSQGAASSTWGAYQHYGHANDKLLPLANVD